MAAGVGRAGRRSPDTPRRFAGARGARRRGHPLRSGSAGLQSGQQTYGGFGGHPCRKWTGAFRRLVSLVELAARAGEPRLLAAVEPVLGWLTGKGPQAKYRGDRRRGPSLRVAGGKRARGLFRLALAGDPRVTGADLPVAEFGFPGALRDALVAAILGGEKTSTTGLLAEYEREGRPLEKVGDRELVLDSQGASVAVIETTKVEVRRMRDVDLAFAVDEGEGFTTLAEWRDAHVRFFTSPQMIAALGEPPVTIDDETLVVCSRFRLVTRL